MDVNTKANY